jgi:hypothetical protein
MLLTCMKREEAKQPIDAKTESELFDVLLQHKVSMVVGEIGVDSHSRTLLGTRAGWLSDGYSPYLWARDIHGEDFDLDDDDERGKLGFGRDDAPPFAFELMLYRVDRFFDRYSEKLKKNWQAKGTITYDVAERTVTLKFLVRNGQSERHYIEVT